MAKRAKSTGPVSDPLLGAMDQADAAVTVGKRCSLTFDRFFKDYPIAPDYQWGRHTHAIAAELQLMYDSVERGVSYHGILSVPPRHGKSDLCSRRFPAWALLRNPDWEIMLATYGAELSEDMSRIDRRIFEEAGKRFGLRIADDKSQVGAWGIQDHRGGMYAIGLGGAITGRGAHILVIDDYCKNREEAESETIRSRVWESFRNDLFTRLAPVHGLLILATRWHEDDLINRILTEMKADPKFPRFKLMNFPAWSDETGWLFPERFPAEWYEQQRAAVGSYGWQSLYMGDPKPRTGNLLRADLVEVVDKLPDGLRFSRGWDLASTEKERVKDDPDFTVGTKAAFDGTTLWVADVRRGQWNATERDRRILQTARDDGSGIPVRIEVVAGYKDTYTRIRDLLIGRAVVRPLRPKGDKVTRASVFEPIFEAGRVKILRAPWNEAWRAEVASFPKGKKDDQVDSLVVAAEDALAKRGRFKMSS